jgi:hypothetical protein
MQIDGACHCGHITFRAQIDPEEVLICHCTDCQTLSGTAFRVVAFTSVDGFELVTGTPKIYVKIADSGNEREQAFCPECGTPLYASSVGGGPRRYGVRVGAVRQRAELVPKKQFWCRSEQAWVGDVGKLPRAE